MDIEVDVPREDILVHMAKITAAYLSNNQVDISALPDLIKAVYTALSMARQVQEPVQIPPVSAVPIRKSVTRDYIICLEDGKKLKMLRRYLRTAYDMTPEEYRLKWGLPADYPMVAPAYASQRSALARSIGLGRNRKKRSA